MQPHVVAHYQRSHFLDHGKSAERILEHSQRVRRLGHLYDLVVAEHQRSTLDSVIEDQNGPAVFLAQFELAIRDAKESVALLENSAPRVSDRSGALLSFDQIKQPEFRFEVFQRSLLYCM